MPYTPITAPNYGSIIQRVVWLSILNTVANIHHADAFSGATVDLQACGGQLLEMNLAVLFRLKAQ
jgi:hypothetical protein